MTSLAASIDRPLALRMRPDLVVREAWFGGQRHFVIQDPLALTYTYLSEEEHAVLAMLVGSVTSAQVVEQFERRFAPRTLAASQLQNFLAELHRRGLVVGQTVGEGERLRARRLRRGQFHLLRLLEKVLAYRWRGIQPGRLLDTIEPLFGWLFRPAGLLLWLAVIVTAAVLLSSRIEEIGRRLPSVTAWLTPRGIVALAAATIVVKTLHELGHALAARRFGCRVREMGVQLFFLLPCLYTDVSEVWLLPDKWRRIAVSAAGIYVELLIAALAGLVWWFAEPGWLSSFCLGIVGVASMGTIVLNGNPLMRYDGYYILSDLVETPNLDERSRTQLVAGLTSAALGTPWQTGTLDDPPRPWLAAYGAAALVYRSIILIGMYYAVRAMLAPWRLEPLGDVLLAAAALGIVLPLAIGIRRIVMHARARRQLSPKRLALSTLVVVGLIIGLLCAPLPQRVRAPAAIEADDAAQVYVTVAGSLEVATPAGTPVRAGDALVRLRNPELERDLVRLTSELRQQELHLAALETSRGLDPQSQAAIPAARQSLADLQARIEQVRSLQNRLTLRAEQDGVVLPPPRVQPPKDQVQLASWSGTPLDQVNRGCWLETGTLACVVGQPGHLRGVAIIDQADVPLVQTGQRAWLSVRQAGGAPLACHVEEVAQIDSADVPPHLAATGAVPQQVGADGRTRPLARMYLVRLALEAAPAEVLPGATGHVLIQAPPETVATRLARWLGRTFRFSGG